MELKILNLEKQEIGKIHLPRQFKEDIRPDLIRRAVVAIRSGKKCPYGASPKAGKRASAVLSRRRHDYRGSYGHGISRVPRKILSRRGTRMNWVGAFAPGTVGGRRAHPPKPTKKWYKKINDKEENKAIRSAISATVINELVMKRGHVLPDNYPFVIDSKIESLKKTKDIKKVLERLGLESELIKSKGKKIRAGKGKSRGRKYRKKKGPLIVVSKNCDLLKTAGNIPGLDVIHVKKLNTEILSPGANPGRLTLWSKDSIEVLKKEGLYESNNQISTVN